MSTDPEPTLENLFSLPRNIKIRTKKFPANMASSLVPVPSKGDKADSSNPRPEFKICWEDQQYGLSVLVWEREDGRLIADVFCTNPGLLNDAWVSVGLWNSGVDHTIRHSILLNVPEKNGCSGSHDFGLLTDVVKELGSQLGVIVFLLLKPGVSWEKKESIRER